MSTPPVNPPSLRFPFNISGKVHPEVEKAIRWAFNGLTNHEQAFAALQGKLNTAKTAAATAVQNVSTATETIVVESPARAAYTAITAAYTILLTDSQIECTSGTFTVTLPTALQITGQAFSIKNSGTGTITLAASGGQTIDGSATQPLTTYDNITVMSNGSNWIVI